MQFKRHHRSLYSIECKAHILNIYKEKVSIICIETGDILPLADMSIKFNIEKSLICACCHNKINYAKGYHFAYSNDASRIEVFSRFKNKPAYSWLKPVVCLETGIEYTSYIEAAKATGIAKGEIYGCCIHTQKSARGYHWCFKAEYDVNNKFLGQEPSRLARINKIWCAELNETFDSLTDAEKVGGSGLHACLHKEAESIAGGYHWSYADDYTRIDHLKKYINKPQFGLEPILCRELNKQFINYREAGKELHIAYSLIKSALQDSYRTAGGYHFVYVSKQNESISKKPVINAREVICIETGISYQTVSEAMKKTGCLNISACCKNHSKTSKGYHWCYADEYAQYTEVKKKASWNAHKIINLDTQEHFDSIKDVLIKYSHISRGILYRALVGKQECAGGYHWKYIEEDTTEC